MHTIWRAGALAAAALTVAASTAACSTSGANLAAAASRTSAAISSARNARPGVYGTPADPSLPNPTNVATDPTPSPVASGGVVGVSITFSGWNQGAREVQVGAYVAGVIESGGVCTLTLTQGSRTVQTSAAAHPGASTTSCAELDLPASEVPSGTWQAVVSYRSATAHGSSRPQEVTVP